MINELSLIERRVHTKLCTCPDAFTMTKIIILGKYFNVNAHLKHFLRAFTFRTSNYYFFTSSRKCTTIGDSNDVLMTPLLKCYQLTYVKLNFLSLRC